jgi:phosphocarrier protein
MAASSASPVGAGTLQREFVLLNRQGLHARPAAMIVKAASRYDAEVFVEKDGNQVSGKSILGLMTLEACCGSTLRVSASGPGAREVLEELAKIIRDRFDEE